MKFYITGSTRGLGKYLKEQFNCIAFDRPTDINTNIDTIVNNIDNDSVVILNAHASQLQYVTLLKDRCRLVICGSIAAINFDPNMIEYSKDKKELEDTVTQIALDNKKSILYLRLTGSSYANYNTISNTIKFWLENPSVTFVGYNI